MGRHRFRDFFRDIFGSQRAHQPDWKLISVIGFLVVFGLAILSSAGAAEGFKNFGDSYWHVKHQLLYGFLPGMVLFFLFSRIDYRRWKAFAPPLLVASVVLLILVFVPGIGSSHSTVARSWLNIGGFSLQPSELVKLTYLLYLVSWLVSRGEKIRDFRRGFLPFIIVLLIITALILFQPDFGTMSIIVMMSLIVYFAAGARLRHLAWLAGLGVGGLGLLIKLSPYRVARLTTFLHPELDPQGVGYHINQALLAVGSGGIFGRGFGHSRQKFAYLPEVTGDSIFAVMAEELGFIFALIIVIAFVYLAIRGFKLARECRDPFARLLVVGIISWFVFQAFLNIGGVIGILPMTGVPLPFVSYGGTAMLTSLAAAGILVNISKQVKNI